MSFIDAFAVMCSKINNDNDNKHNLLQLNSVQFQY
jgi:hypothetical protein